MSALAWTFDGRTLAIGEVVEGRSRIAVMTSPDWQARTLGEGGDPKWSASGGRIAFSRGKNLVIADPASGREVATLTPAAPGFGWSGDTLLYWGGTSLRGWRDGRDARFGAHVPDLTPLRGDRDVTFSADGSRFAITARDGTTTTVAYGATADGRVSVLPLPDRVRWSTSGANALFTGGGPVVLLRPEKRLFASETLPSRFAVWSPDGEQALFGADPNGAGWDVIGWDGQKMGATVRLMSGLRTGAFSPDGAYLAATYDDGLRLYRCSATTQVPTGLITRNQAKQVIQRSGDLIKVNLEDSKLIRWADIRSVLTGSWATVGSEASNIDPSTPVWLLMYAGEAKQPAGTSLEASPGVRSPTVSLVLYVLDARTGQELGARVAAGTWWIGQPFESLVDRAPDPTPHPFEPARTAPPVPSPRPTPTLPTSSAAPGLARVESPAGGWRVDFPDGWWPSRVGFAGVSLSTRDPDLGIASAALTARWNRASDLRIELWGNPERLGLDEWVSKNLDDNLVVKTLDRTHVTIAGKTALLMRREMGPQPPDNSMLPQEYWVVPTARADRMLVITASPADSVYANEVDAAVASLALFAPHSPAYTIDITREQVLSRWSNGPLGTAGRAEAKLVTWAEANAVERGIGLRRLDRDPEQLVWIVAVSAVGAQPGFSFPSRGLRGNEQPFRWQLYVTPASSTDDGSGTWSQSSSNGDWPEVFDSLADRCC